MLYSFVTKETNMRHKNTALLVVDMQQGFTQLCSSELPIIGGLAIVPAVNELLKQDWARIDASQDWHPARHCSFKAQGGPYHPHCIQNSRGAEFIPHLLTSRFQTIWRKGYDADFEAYAVTAQHPNILPMYGHDDVSTVVICGIATNICIYAAAKDFISYGFKTIIVEDASVGIDVPEAGLFQEATKKEGLALGIEYKLVKDFV
jgi:nicotinamidase/pyrazinamidase